MEVWVSMQDDEEISLYDFLCKEKEVEKDEYQDYL